MTRRVTANAGKTAASHAEQEGLSRVQRALLKFLCSRMSLKQVALNRQPLEGAFQDFYWVSSGHFEGDSAALLSISFPETSHSVFMSVAQRSFKSVFEHLLCELNAQSESDDAFRPGAAQRMESGLIVESGWSAVLLAKASDFFRGLPSSLNVGGDAFDFVLVIPITEEEYGIWSASGYTGLLGYFGRPNLNFLLRRSRLTSAPRASAAKRSHASSGRSAIGNTTAGNAVPGTDTSQLSDPSVRPLKTGHVKRRSTQAFPGDQPQSSPLDHQTGQRIPGFTGKGAQAALQRFKEACAQRAAVNNLVPGEHSGQPGAAKPAYLRHVLSGKQLSALERMGNQHQYAYLLKTAGVVSLGCLVLVGAMALGLLPAVFAAGGVGMLYAAYRDVVSTRD